MAAGQLAKGAFFFAMRSCEYVQTYGERRTKLLELRNLRFFKDHREVPHNSPGLYLTDSITITFFFQKNDKQDATVTQHRTLDLELCPVTAWAGIVKRILSYDGTGPTTPVCTIKGPNGTLSQLSSKQLLNRLRASVKTVGEDELGFKSLELGTHSIRSGAAMAMYSPAYPSSLSCSLVNGPVMHLYATSVTKSKSSARECPRV